MIALDRDREVSAQMEPPGLLKQLCVETLPRLRGISRSGVFSPSRAFKSRYWCPRPDLNRDARFRKPLLYPVELRGQTSRVTWNERAAVCISKNAG